MSNKDKSKNVSPVETEKENLSVVFDSSKDKTVKTKADERKKNVKKNKKDKKEKGKFKRKTKETFSEIKKVTWPSFAEVCKKTGVVLAVVFVFAVVIFGIDYGLGALMSLLTRR